MTRPLRLEVIGGTHHVTSRGNRREPVFVDDADRQAYMQILGRTVRDFRWKLLTFCLMDNHTHLLVQTSQPNLSRGMQRLNGGYAQAFNRRHALPGSLWQGRFHSSLVQVDRYMREVLRYIALNPVRAGMVAAPEDWAWSGYAAITGRAEAPPFLAADEALRWFGGDVGVFRAFVAAGDPAAELPEHGVVLGDDAFARTHLPVMSPSPEIAKRHWTPGRPPLAELLATHDLEEAMMLANAVYGYSLAAIAAELGVHASTISRRLRGR